MRHGSLFSGIGGFELAAEWMGWENTFHCEFNEFGSKVLSHYWLESKHYGDITKSDFSEFRDRIDILTGGFPCQPYSAAGKRKGKDDARHLWPEMLRVIREVRPRYIVGENVYGLVTWNGGLVFDEVCTDLEAEGYAVWPIVIPAAAVNAPHRRDRVWFIAYSNNARISTLRCKFNGNEQKEMQQWQQSQFESYGSSNKRTATDSENSGHRGRVCGQCADRKRELFQNECKRSEVGCKAEGCCRVGLATDSENSRLASCIERPRQEQSRRRDEPIGARQWQGFPTQSPVCSGDDGLPFKLDGITFPKWRNESIKAYGNAIVPQVAYQIFKAIEDHDYRAMA
jgi:DNA (cytosine-5)-methyltransferase 1